MLQGQMDSKTPTQFYVADPGVPAWSEAILIDVNINLFKGNRKKLEKRFFLKTITGDGVKLP